MAKAFVLVYLDIYVLVICLITCFFMVGAHVWGIAHHKIWGTAVDGDALLYTGVPQYENAFSYTGGPQYMGMYSHTWGYLIMWECILIDWGTPV